MSKLLYIVKFDAKNQLCSNKECEFFYNKKLADEIVDNYRTDKNYWATLHTIQPKE